MTGAATYRGNCHCGANRFEVTLPEISSALACDCSLCCKNQPLWVFVDDDDALAVTRGGEQTLNKYKSAALEEEVCPNHQARYFLC